MPYFRRICATAEQLTLNRIIMNTDHVAMGIRSLIG